MFKLFHINSSYGEFKYKDFKTKVDMIEHLFLEVKHFDKKSEDNFCSVETEWLHDQLIFGFSRGESLEELRDKYGHLSFKQMFTMCDLVELINNGSCFYRDDWCDFSINCYHWIEI